MNLVLVLLGAAVGAPMRYLTDRAVQSRHSTLFPFGTFAVNIIACLVLGAVLAVAPHDVQLLVGTGFCGALSTYSTFAYESMRLAEQGSRLLAVANIVGSIVAGLAAAFLGAGFAAAAF
jgi:CrcB protein